ncbi:MAG: META domain-containing protein [Kiloniellales bacterium]|nr:META domain-containing protein [Kiloniellales bacterium]
MIAFRLLLVALCALVPTVLPATSALAEASGPDFYRVVDVDATETLSLRTGASTGSTVIAELPHDAGGLANMGCRGGLTLQEWTEASESEREASRHRRWCLVGFERVVGWVPGRFLAEGGPPDRFRGGGRLGALRGSEWRLVRIGDGLADLEATIAFQSGGHVSGDAGCNRFMGSYAEDRGSLSVGPLATTRKICPEEIMAGEARFLAMLEESRTRAAWHLVLALLDERGGVVAQFARMDWD